MLTLTITRDDGTKISFTRGGLQFVDDGPADADLQILAVALTTLCKEYPELVRPHTAECALEAALLTLDAAEGLDDPAEFYVPAQELTGRQIGHLLMQGLQNGDKLTHDDKQRALDAAEVMGPEWAQVLYRFAVLVTKLA